MTPIRLPSCNFEAKYCDQLHNILRRCYAAFDDSGKKSHSEFQNLQATGSDAEIYQAFLNYLKSLRVRIL